MFRKRDNFMELVRIYYDRPDGNSYSAVVKESQIQDIKRNSDINITGFEKFEGNEAERDYILR